MGLILIRRDDLISPGNEHDRGDAEALCQAADLSNVEFALAGEDF
jgi:hypothetical protein